MFTGISTPLEERSTAWTSHKVFRHSTKRGGQVPGNNAHSHARPAAPPCAVASVSRHIPESVLSEIPLFPTNFAVCIVGRPKVHVSSRESLTFLSESINLAIITGRNLKMQFRPDGL